MGRPAVRLFGACSTSLCPGQGRYTMQLPEIQIGNSGLLASKLTWKVRPDPADYGGDGLTGLGRISVHT